MWSKAQVATFQRAIATAEQHEDAIRRLEAIARQAPALADRVAELRAMRDNLHAVASAALAIDPTGDQ